MNEVVSLRLSEEDKAFAKYFAKTDSLSKAIRAVIDHARSDKKIESTDTEARSSIRPRRIGTMPSNLFKEESTNSDDPAFSSRP